MKLSRPGAAAPAQAQNETQTETARPQPKGWGQKGAAAADDGQKDRIQDQINPEANKTAFSRGVQEQARGISTGFERVDPSKPLPISESEPEPSPKAPRTRRAPREDQAQAADAGVDAAKAAVMDALGAAGGKYLRVKAVELASQSHFAANFESTEDFFSLADEILAYLNKD